MQPMTLARIAAATGGQVAHADANAEVVRIAFDARKVEFGDLFVALVGHGRDGHDDARAAVEAGAVAVLAGRSLDLPAVVVRDPLTALGELAHAWVLTRPGMDVIAVTGSSGTAFTKDLIAQVVARLGMTVYTRGSFDDELDLPLTALEATPDTRHLVVEMGVRRQGHIAYLTQVTPPKVGVVLDVGAGHSAGSDGPEMTAKAEGELIEALPHASEGGVAVLNADDTRVAAMAARTTARVVTFGLSQDADVCATGIVLDDRGRPSFTLRTPAGDAPVRLRVSGEFQVPNALASAGAGGAVGMDVLQIAEALSSAKPLDAVG